MSPVQTFLEMGGYAAYVWPSLAIAAVVLGTLLFVSLRSRAATAAQLARLGADADETAS